MLYFGWLKQLFLLRLEEHLGWWMVLVSAYAGSVVTVKERSLQGWAVLTEHWCLWCACVCRLAVLLRVWTAVLNWAVCGVPVQWQGAVLCQMHTILDGFAHLTQHGKSFSSHQGLLCRWNFTGLAGKHNASPLCSHTTKQPELRNSSDELPVPLLLGKCPKCFFLCKSNLTYCLQPCLVVVSPLSSGVCSRNQKGKSSPVQISCQVLPRGCVWRADPRHHTEALLPAGEGRDPQRWDLLSSWNSSSSWLICCAGQIWRLQQRCIQAWIPQFRASDTPEVKDLVDAVSLSSVLFEVKNLHSS